MKATTGLLVALGLGLLMSCGGDGGGSTPITSFELLDPTPGAGDQFGLRVVILSNGNIVVTDTRDSSVASSNGAVHVYNPVTQARLASIYGDNANDFLGSGGITELSNGNFVIVSSSDHVGGVVSAGSVMLINGTTGAPIGSTITGDNASDLLGSEGATALSNGNFVIVSPADDVGGVADAGSVKLFNGTTGAPIGSTIAGDNVGDQLGSGSVTALSNGNFVIASPSDDVGGVVDAGSVKLFNGTTGAPIGSTIAGDNANDVLGSDVTALPNGNFVIVLPGDDVGGVVNAGSVKLINGTTGAPIGSTIAGDTVGDSLGSGGVTALSNGNFVIASRNDDVGGVVDAGSVMLINGTTGAPIGSTIVGDNAGDQLGLGGATALSNGNFAIASHNDDVGGMVNAGSVMLINGTTGAPIGSTIAGDNAGDFLGFGGVTALSNANFVIVSPLDDVGGVADAGSVMLINGTTGAPIGSTIAGVVSGDVDQATVAGSATGNFFVLGLPAWDKNGLGDSGLARLIAP